jgi:two-component system LytT family sensor kinase
MIFIKHFKTVKFTRTSIIIWLLYIFYEVSITYFLTKKAAPFFDYVNGYTLNIIIFYFHSHFLMPRIQKRAIYIKVLSVILELIGYMLFKYILTYIFFLLHLSAVDPFVFTDTFLIQTIWRFIYFAGLSTGYWYALYTILQAREIANLEKSKLLDELKHQQLGKKLIDSENAYLKSQINPHFLFNTLNFLYNTALQTAEHLAKPIMLLSDIMRYALTETPQSGKVELIDEIEQMYSLIDLNQYRFDQNLQLSFDVHGDNRNLKILPLLLLTPVENIFKYADLNDENNPARILLKIDGKQLYFSIQNRKLKRIATGISNGVGMKNLQLRLDAHYAGNYSLQINNNANEYKFELQLKL